MKILMKKLVLQKYYRSIPVGIDDEEIKKQE